MKCTYSFPAESVLTLEAPLLFSVAGRLYTFAVTDGFISALDVTVADYPHDLWPKLETRTKTWQFPRDPILSNLLPDIRTIEGVLSIWGIRKIETREFTIVWSPDPVDLAQFPEEVRIEKKRLDPRMYAAKRTDPSLLVRSILSLDRLRELEVSLNFNRRAREAIRDDRYIEAIYEFYFYIESRFGNGKFKSAAIVNELLKAPVLMKSIDAAIENPHPDVLADELLRSQFEKDYRTKSRTELVTQLVELRGFLHHHSEKDKQRWNPGSQ